MVPIPIAPIGVPLVGAGLHVLATEFDEAKRAEYAVEEFLDGVKSKIAVEYDEHCNTATEDCHEDELDRVYHGYHIDNDDDGDADNDFSEQDKLIEQAMQGSEQIKF